MAGTFEYRVRFEVDPDAQFEECNGESRPLTRDEYKANVYLADNGTREIPYDEYLRYYGNPDRHVYLMSRVQRKCSCCGQWADAGGTGHIDMMDDDPVFAHHALGLPTGQWLTEEEARQLPGYLAEVAAEDIDQARSEDARK